MLPLHHNLMNGYGYAFQATKCLHRVLLCVVCCSVVALRIELSAIRLSDAGFFLLANAGAPALDYHLIKSGVSESNRSRSPQTTCASHYTSRPIVVTSVDKQGIEPCHLDCKSKPRSYGQAH